MSAPRSGALVISSTRNSAIFIFDYVIRLKNTIGFGIIEIQITLESEFESH